MPDLLIIGNGECFHVGAHFLNAARALEIPVELLDVREASEAPAWKRHVDWWLRGRRLPRMDEFGRRVLAIAREHRPRLLLATGIAPITRDCLREIRQLGAACCNFLTDDPWNPAHRAPWFCEALPAYAWIFSPRTANSDDLLQAGCRNVAHLQFAYAPEIHFPEQPLPTEQQHFDCDIMLAGGADPDRLPYVRALIAAGLRVALYGGYWDRHADLRPFARGHADPSTLRKATGAARLVLGLVRRANRDGHAMRTFEVPAMKGCLLLEDTEEHRGLFGADGEAVCYFSNLEELVARARALISNPTLRDRLSTRAHALVVNGGHTYADRLRKIFATVPELNRELSPA
jgi:spore maturation protein CgeB